MNELFIVMFRYAVFAFFVWLSERGIIAKDQVNTIADQIVNILPMLGAVMLPVWAGFVRYNTRAVPAATAARADVPTVNSLTGAKEPGPSKT